MTTDTAESGRLKHGIVLANWLADGDPGWLVELAVLAEEAGWDGVFLADHLISPSADPSLQDFPDPWITMAAIAARTDRVKLASWVTPVPRRQPWQLARDLATLDRLSNGRVILGTGLGRSFDYTTFGRDYDQRALGERYDEALDVVDGLWSGEPFSYDGEHFTLDEAVVRPTPVQQPRIPIVVGGIWPNRKPFQRGARWDGIVPHYRGDGVIPADGAGIVPPREGTHEEEVREMLAYYHDLTDDPGEIFLPANPPEAGDDWLDTCAELGTTWLYTRPMNEDGEWSLTAELVREGPPK